MSVDATICEAIAEMRCLRIKYHDHDRIIEPHVLGSDRLGNDILCAFLIGGFTQSPGPPYWRLYKVSQIKSAVKLEQHFNGPRDGYNREDHRMVRIHCRIE